MNHRYDFLYLFDVADANPNGDPDAGNLPRLDPETGHGLITDVCLKRKIRNFVQLTKPECQAGNNPNGDPRYDIYVREKAILNDQHQRAYAALTLKPEKKKLPKKLEDAEAVRRWMCHNFYDIRTFGAVMTTDVNCGQVRGPVQLAFSRSVDPIVTSEHAVTRMAVTTPKEAEAQQGDNRTMGRKFTVPYALYRTHGFINPFLAGGGQNGTGFSEGRNLGEPKGDDGSDLELFFTALENAFQFDQSAARPAGSMAPRLLLAFRHENQLGKAPSHTLFDRLQITSFEDSPAPDGKPPRKYADYKPRITFDGQPLDEFVSSGQSKVLGNGITLIRRI